MAEIYIIGFSIDSKINGGDKNPTSSEKSGFSLAVMVLLCFVGVAARLENRPFPHPLFKQRNFNLIDSPIAFDDVVAVSVNWD